ncbi:phosphoacetylglucosamine mutase [Micractinium conductrix]|uniref:Phosphoacetylglucosamine mutase n=1 Tax=Micractinium conductrix TaxID=554055 RepID=A0A2P6VDG2_9CHLO|nr:phosphoacetylglucosamine mutase [Micractinium conductrix]|eukprot:PSC72140.1 phosphoacetylglucosamine mutase [Micractinium conductrix]
MAVPTSVGAAVEAASARYPLAKGFRPSYGTAGFRALAELLDSTMFRCGIMMAARAIKASAITGICITASHNPAPDNGVKLVEPSGEMLCQEWETYANDLANAQTDSDLIAQVASLLAREGIAAPGGGIVMIAHDTRPSGPHLAEAAAAGVRCLGVEPQMCGLLTTPQLHWMVMSRNRGQPWAEADYCAALAGAYQQLVAGTQPLGQTLYMDCANGVGAPKMAALAQQLAGAGLAVDLRNTGEGVLNGGCGSDFLQKDRQLPANYADVPAGARCCAVDGDSDRLMYFTPLADTPGKALLFDGDRIACLSAMLLRDLISALPPGAGDVSVGIIQTAYANGAASAYIRDNLGCAVEVTPTGVKYLHEAAHHYDCGVYFEANGHGTVLFVKDFLARLEQLAGESRAAADLLALSVVINQAVGDALSGILLVEAALRRRAWGLDQWAALYTDLPSRQLKVTVADRTVITTTDAETRCASPAGLQAAIDAAVAPVPRGRAFVRPSGTEDVVRVYAEADSQEAADALAGAVAKLVHAQAGGVGPAP